MTDLLESMIAFLLADTGIAAAFGNNIFAYKTPDVDVNYPFAILRVVTDQPTYMFNAESLRETIIQIDTFDDDLSDCVTNSELIRAKLTGHSGTMGSHTVGAVFVRDGRHEWMTDGRHFKKFEQFMIKWTV